MTRHRERTVRTTTNNIEIHYELTGSAHAPVVVLSHSLGSAVTMWDPQVEALSSRFRVLRFDTRGHGRSSAPGGSYRLDQLTDDVVDLLAALDIDRVHWVGLSMGGMIGQGLALRYPERLNSLVLSDTMAVVTPEMQEVWLERINTAREQGMRALADATIERWFTEAFRRAHPEAVEPIRRQFIATPVSGYIGCCEAIRHLNYLPRLGEIKLPTLILVGAADPATPVSASEAMHRRMPASQLVVIPEAAHLSNVEQSGRYTELVQEFIASVAQ